jgi:hypothetical protein
VGFGFGAEKGTKDQQIEFRNNSFYGYTNSGPKVPDMNA